MNPYKWEKFWLAVHVLREWVHWKAWVDDTTRQVCVDVFLSAVDGISKVNGPRAKYERAGLLAEETQMHKTLYAEFTSGLGLTAVEKEGLMNFLLQQKRKVMELFAKVEFLDARRTLVATSDTLPSLRQLDVQEYRIANGVVQGVVCTLESLRQSALANPLKIRLAQLDDDSLGITAADTAAAQALLGLSRGQHAMHGHDDVRVLLDCLRRLAVDEVGEAGEAGAGGEWG